MATLLYGNISQKTASYTIEPGAITLPKVVQGDTFSIAVRLTETADNLTTITAPSISYARLAYGPVDVAPTSGSFKVRVNAVTSSVITFGSTAASVAAVLNSIAAATGWSVLEDQGSYIVGRTSNWVATSGITIVQNELVPDSFVRVTSYSANNTFYQELRPMQSPLAYTSAFALIVPPPPSITRVVTGYSDAATGVYVNEVQRLFIPPSFGTTFQIYRGTSRTALLNKDDGADEIQAALLAGCVTVGAGETFLVTNPENYVANIEFAGSMSGAPQSLLTVSVPVSPQGDPTFDLDLNTQGMLAALRGDFEVTHPLTCEIGINYGTAVTPNVQYVTVFQQDLTTQADGAWTGLAAAQRINWLNPPQPVNYIPFTTDQVITGIQSFTAVVTGAGPWTIAHNLGTEAIHVTVRENVAGGYILSNRDNADLGHYKIQTSTSQSIIVTDINGNGAGATTGWAVMISSAGPTSAFLAHTHTIAQVVSLQDQLNSLGSRLASVEDILPATGISSSSSVTQPYEIPVSARQAVMFSNGLGLWADADSILQITSVPSVQAPQLLEALSVTVGTAASVALPTVTTVDIVRAYTSGLNILVPRIGLIPGARLPTGVALIGAESTRGLVYQVDNYSSGRTYYPKAYEATLFEIPINDKLFRAGTTAKLQWNLNVQSKAANATAQWFCIVDVGTITTVSTPATQTTNISDITWNSTPILSQQLIVTGEPVKHGMGVEILATSATQMDANYMSYGIWASATTGKPSSRNFILRGRLANFDVIDTQGDARGWLGYAMRPYGDASQIKIVIE
jgi:hypothetical protein